jgi:hypothetical protein
MSSLIEREQAALHAISRSPTLETAWREWLHFLVPEQDTELTRMRDSLLRHPKSGSALDEFIDAVQRRPEWLERRKAVDAERDQINAWINDEEPHEWPEMFTDATGARPAEFVLSLLTPTLRDVGDETPKTIDDIAMVLDEYTKMLQEEWEALGDWNKATGLRPPLSKAPRTDEKKRDESKTVRRRWTPQRAVRRIWQRMYGATTTVVAETFRSTATLVVSVGGHQLGHQFFNPAENIGMVARLAIVWDFCCTNPSGAMLLVGSFTALNLLRATKRGRRVFDLVAHQLPGLVNTYFIQILSGASLVNKLMDMMGSASSFFSSSSSLVEGKPLLNRYRSLDQLPQGADTSVGPFPGDAMVDLLRGRSGAATIREAAASGTGTVNRELVESLMQLRTRFQDVVFFGALGQLTDTLIWRHQIERQRDEDEKKGSKSWLTRVWAVLKSCTKRTAPRIVMVSLLELYWHNFSAGGNFSTIDAWLDLYRFAPQVRDMAFAIPRGVLVSSAIASFYWIGLQYVLPRLIEQFLANHRIGDRHRFARRLLIQGLAAFLILHSQPTRESMLRRLEEEELSTANRTFRERLIEFCMAVFGGRIQRGGEDFRPPRPLTGSVHATEALILVDSFLWSGWLMLLFISTPFVSEMLDEFTDTDLFDVPSAADALAQDVIETAVIPTATRRPNDAHAALGSFAQQQLDRQTPPSLNTMIEEFGQWVTLAVPTSSVRDVTNQLAELPLGSDRERTIHFEPGSGRGTTRVTVTETVRTTRNTTTPPQQVDSPADSKGYIDSTPSQRSSSPLRRVTLSSASPAATAPTRRGRLAPEWTTTLKTVYPGGRES